MASDPDAAKKAKKARKEKKEKKRKKMEDDAVDDAKAAAAELAARKAARKAKRKAEAAALGGSSDTTGGDDADTADAATTEVKARKKAKKEKKEEKKKKKKKEKKKKLDKTADDDMASSGAVAASPPTAASASGGGAIVLKHQPSTPDDPSVAELERLAPVLPGGRRLASRHSHESALLPPLPPHRCLIFFAEGLFTFGRSFVDAIVRGTASIPRTTTLVFTEYLTPSELAEHKDMALEMCLENVRTITSLQKASCECLCRLGVDATFCRFGLPAGTRLPRSSALFASGVYAIKDPSAKDSNAIANTRALMTGMMASSASLQEADDSFYLTFGLSIKETASRYRKNHRSDFEWESELQSGWNANGWLQSVLDGGEQGELLEDGRACFLRLVMFAPDTWMKYYEPRRCGSLGSGTFYRHCQTASVAPVGNCRDFVLELRRSDAEDEDEEKRRLRELCCLVHAAYCQTFWERESQLKGKKSSWRRAPEEMTIRDSNRLIGEHSGVRILQESLQGGSEGLSGSLRERIWNLRKDNLPWE